jgi:hypothetical protein
MMKRAIFNYGFWLFLIAMVLGTSVAATQKDTAGAFQSDSPSASDVVQVKTAWSVDRARPGDPVVLAVVIDIKDGIHINADARQVQPPKFRLSLPPKASPSRPLAFPRPYRLKLIMPAAR